MEACFHQGLGGVVDRESSVGSWRDALSCLLPWRLVRDLEPSSSPGLPGCWDYRSELLHQAVNFFFNCSFRQLSSSLLNRTKSSLGQEIGRLEKATLGCDGS